MNLASPTSAKLPPDQILIKWRLEALGLQEVQVALPLRFFAVKVQFAHSLKFDVDLNRVQSDAVVQLIVASIPDFVVSGGSVTLILIVFDQST